MPSSRSNSQARVWRAMRGRGRGWGVGRRTPGGGAGGKSVIARLANRLQRRLMARQTRAWEFDLDEGILDAARLSRVVTNPVLPLSYKRERETDFRDTVVTLLIDLSLIHI